MWGGEGVGGGEALAPVQEVEGPWRQSHVAVSTVWSLARGPPICVTGVQWLPSCKHSSVQEVLFFLSMKTELWVFFFSSLLLSDPGLQNLPHAFSYIAGLSQGSFSSLHH